MLINADITVYNAVVDRDDGVTTYNRTHIYGVSWQQMLKAAVVDKGLKTADVTDIFISFLCDTEGKTYLKPCEYDLSDDKSEYFTLKKGDIIVKGIIDDDILLPAKFKQSHDDVVTILSIESCDYGSPYMQHWEVGAS